MSERLESLAQGLLALLTTTVNATGTALAGLGRALRRAWILVLALILIGGSGYELVTHPPFRTLEPGEVGIRSNKLTGGITEVRDGLVVVIPGLHELRRYSLLDQVYRPVRSSKANGEAPFQSIEGLSLGVDLTIRYAIDPARLVGIAKELPADINGEIVEPMVQGVIYKSFTRYSVRDIFSTKRGEIQKEIENELKPKLAADGIILRGVQMGQVDLPPEYRQGMEKLLAEELESEKMKYTLELKSKQVQQTELEAEADKVKREKSAEAAGNEQIIAAKAQEEAMKHVLPFKQKQIEQRQYEAEAEKVSRIKTAEGSAEARRIEASGEADSRHKLADVEAYRLETIGKVTSAQLERDGALISKNPLLIQKTMADKLSDKISVIIAAPPANGGFIGSALLGGGQAVASQTQQVNAAQETQQ
ncbi:prohibitin family protein [Collimonas pratensis]|uniref:SPFH domain / Band 7 family protein n=1 Tax=Collimonas pratensis TaxID=279113 RepID=A0ABN4M8X2_9BURK|nr:SPFH domain-containing protein [Collimonas pratensis]AMP14226.1 SPFH domain / Band 7 family protein [Collimonas pratensis]